MPMQAPQWTEFLICPVCQYVFSSSRPPISLVCGHTVCKVCLGKLNRTQCMFDQVSFSRHVSSYPINYALLNAAGEKSEGKMEPPHSLLSPEETEAYQRCQAVLISLAGYLKNSVNGGTKGSGVAGATTTSSNGGIGALNGPLTRQLQRKLVSLLTSQLVEPEGRLRALRNCRGIGERIVTELILLHQNPQELSSNLWTAVRTRGCQFLGPAMQEEVLKLVILALEDGSALSRKVLVMFIVQRLEGHYPQASKTSIGHVVQLLYRASCFKVFKREGDSSLMQLKEELRNYEALRREHDAQIVQIAAESGLRIAPDQWSSLLYGDTGHKSHMQSILDKRQSSSGFSLAIQDLVFALQRTGDPAGLSNIVPSLERLAEIPVSCHSGNGMATSTPPEMTPMEVGLSPEEVSSSLLSASVKLEQDPSPSPPPGEGRSIAAGEKAEKSPSEVFPAAPGPEEASAGPTTNPPSLASMGAILEATADCINGLVQYLAKHAPNALFRKDVSLLPQSGLASKYKTSMCRDLAQGRPCPRGSACTFAHSEAELARYRGTPVGGTTPRRTRTPGAVFGTPLNRRAAFAPRTLLPLSTIPPQLLQNRQHVGLAGFPLAPGGYAFPSTPSAPSPGNFIHRPDLFSGSPHGFSPGSFWSGAGGRAPSLVTPPRTRVPVSLLSSQPSSRESAQSAPLSLSQSYPSQPSPASSSFESAVSSSTLNAVTISTQSLIRRNHVVQTQPMPSRLAPHSLAALQQLKQEILEKLEEKLTTFSDPSFANEEYETHDSEGVQLAGYCSSLPLSSHTQTSSMCSAAHNLVPPKLSPVYVAKMSHAADVPSTASSSTAFMSAAHPMTSAHLRLAYCSTVDHCHSNPQTSVVAPPASVNDWLDSLLLQESPEYHPWSVSAISSNATSRSMSMDTTPPSTTSLASVDPPRPRFRETDDDDEYIPFQSPLSVSRFGPISKDIVVSNMANVRITRQMTPIQVEASSMSYSSTIASNDTIPTPKIEERPETPSNFDEGLDFSPIGYTAPPSANTTSGRLITVGHGMVDPPELHMSHLDPSGFRPSDPSPLITARDSVVLVDSEKARLNLRTRSPSGETIGAWLNSTAPNHQTARTSGSLSASHSTSSLPAEAITTSVHGPAGRAPSSSTEAEFRKLNLAYCSAQPCVDPCEEADGLRNDEDALEEELRMIEVGIREKRKELEWNQYRSTPNSWSVSMPASSRWSQADDLVADWGPPCSSSAPEPPASAGSANMFPGFDWSSTSHSRSNAEFSVVPSSVVPSSGAPWFPESSPETFQWLSHAPVESPVAHAVSSGWSAASYEGPADS